jgi:endo-alpha-1,4-polygalactosaminidase (GH114 family)
VNKKTAKPDVEIFDNPLFLESGTDLTVISVNQEVEEKVAIINEIESIATLTRQQIAVKKEQANLLIDNKKIDTAKKTIGAVERIIESVINEEVIERVARNIKTPMDMKFMAEAADKLTSTLKNLMYGSAVDELGNKKKQKINFMFKSSGSVEGVVQIDNSQDE